MLQWFVGLTIVFCLVPGVQASAQGIYKLETLKGLPGGDVAPAIQELLQPQADEVLNSAGKEQCELWLRKEFTPAANPNTAGNVLYGRMAPGSLVGVLQFPENSTDYRGQHVKAGYYTLRYELMPQDGNHMGVSQYRDFLLLIPAAKDPSGTTALSYSDSIALSRGSTDTGHPGILMMEAASESVKQLPAVFQDDSQAWALQDTVSMGPAGLPLAIVVVGQYQGQ